MNHANHTTPPSRLPAHMLFSVGQAATPGALDLLDRTSTNVYDLLFRHQRGDWGDVPVEDAMANTEATLIGDRTCRAIGSTPQNGCGSSMRPTVAIRPYSCPRTTDRFPANNHKLLWWRYGERNKGKRQYPCIRWEVLSIGCFSSNGSDYMPNVFSALQARLLH